jgi:hypothetical protein
MKNVLSHTSNFLPRYSYLPVACGWLVLGGKFVLTMYDEIIALYLVATGGEGGGFGTQSRHPPAEKQEV